MSTDIKQDTPPAHVLDDATKAWAQKEGGVTGDDDYDITPNVTFYRDGAQVAHFMGMRVNKYDAIAAVHLGVRLLEADEVVVSLDSHITHVMENPRTGKPWGPNEMQNLCNDEGACDTGLITDTIVTMRCAPNAPAAMINRKYHVNHTKREVHWVDPFDCMVESAEDTKLGGYMVDSFMAAFHADNPAMPTIPLPEGMSEVEARAHRVVVGLRLLAAVIGGAVIPLEGLDDEVMRAVYEEFLTEEYVRRDMDGPLGILVGMLRVRFGLDDE